MKMDGVFLVGVAGCEICAPTKPVRVAFFQISKIRMNGRNHWAARMEDKRNACCKELGSAAASDLCCELLWEISVDRGEIDSCFLEHTALFKHARATSSSSSSFTRPRVFAKHVSVNLLDSIRDAIL